MKEPIVVVDSRHKMSAACCGVWCGALLLAAWASLTACGDRADAQRGASANAGTTSAQTTATPHNVRVLELRPGNLAEYLVISGPVQPVKGTDISTEESGVVQEFPKDKGDVVEADDVIVLLDRTLLEAEVASAQAELTLCEYNEQRTQLLLDANSVSKQEMLAVRTQREQAQARLSIARERFARAAIKAPFDGVVTERYVEVGQLVQPGMRVARVVDPFTLKVVGWATEQEVALLRKGSSAEVTLDGFPGALEGVVEWVGFEAAVASGKFPVEVRVHNPRLKLRAGAVGRARIQQAVHQQVLAIPRDAVLQQQETNYVYVVEEGVARRREIVLGVDQGMMVEVTSGLRAGDAVVVRGQRDLLDGLPVAIQERSDQRDGTLTGDPEAVAHDSGADPRSAETGEAPR